MNMEARIKTGSVTDLPLAPERVCYEAHWRNRSVFLSAPCQSAREWQWHCLASAILLERLEDACVLAETLLDSSLQFFVSEMPAGCGSSSNGDEGYLRVVLARADDEVEIWLPARAHNQVSQHQNLIDTSKLRWSDVRARVKIAQVALDEQDVSRLMLGSLLLIPESWQTSWMCSVEVPQLKQMLGARLHTGEHALELLTETSSPMKPVSPVETSNIVHAYLNPSIQINPGQLLGTAANDEGNEDSSSGLTVSLTQAMCDCRVNEHDFSAHLLPVGDGYGLSIAEY